MFTKYASMPIVGMRVRSWSTRVMLKNKPANILMVVVAGGCDYCAVEEEQLAAGSRNLMDGETGPVQGL